MIETYTHDSINSIRRLNPIAGAIAWDAFSFFKKVKEERNRMDQSGLEDQTLYVLVGEYHHDTSHVLRKLILTDIVKKNFSDALIALELPHDVDFSALDHIEKLDTLTKSKTLANWFIKLKNKYTILMGEYAPYTQSAFLEHLLRSAQFLRSMDALPLENKLSVINSDCSHCYQDSGAHINHSDKSTRKIVHRLGYDTEQTYPATEADGMHIRNAHMIDALKSYSEAFNSRVTVQFTGLEHIHGKSGSNGYRNSLLSLMHAQNLNVISLSQSTFLQNKFNDLSVYQSFMLGKTALYNQNNPYWSQRDEYSLQTLVKEKAYVDPLLEALGFSNLMKRIPIGANIERLERIYNRQKMLQIQYAQQQTLT